jgi:hypothetical protein
MVENQVPTSLLPNTTATVNAAGFGQLGQSWRLGIPDITTITPTVAWKLTDATHTVYFKPSCVVDWSVNYSSIMTQNVCTTGYTDLTFTTLTNGAWEYCSARGIGVNNSGQNCSMRADEGGVAAGLGGEGAANDGAAHDCTYDTSQTISLWYR